MIPTPSAQLKQVQAALDHISTPINYYTDASKHMAALQSVSSIIAQIEAMERELEACRGGDVDMKLLAECEAEFKHTGGLQAYNVKKLLEHFRTPPTPPSSPQVTEEMIERMAIAACNRRKDAFSWNQHRKVKNRNGVTTWKPPSVIV